MDFAFFYRWKYFFGADLAEMVVRGSKEDVCMGSGCYEQTYDILIFGDLAA